MSNLAPTDGGMQKEVSALGEYTLAEILSQPRCWTESLNQVGGGGIIRTIGKRFGNMPDWIFVGCGSSYYVALAAAASWTAITGTSARAVPASELLLFPDLVFNGAREFVPVLISRSGQTSEVVRAAELFEKRQIPSLAVSCASKQKLETLATVSILLPAADEQSTVMTRSFTAMLLALQYVAASLAGKGDLLEALQALPGAAQKALQDLPIRMREFVNRHLFSDYVCLGQGPYYSLACESSLKVMEMSRSYAQSFHTLEFRHGPKSIVSGATLITFLLSQANYGAEAEVLAEMKGLGGTIVAVASRIDDRVRSTADLVVELGCALPEYSGLAPFVFSGQLMGFYTALQRGLDPDRPRNLSRVVLLQDEKEHPENASIDAGHARP